MVFLDQFLRHENILESQEYHTIERDPEKLAITFYRCNGSFAVLDSFPSFANMISEFKPFKAKLKSRFQWFILKDFYVPKHTLYINLATLKEFKVFIGERGVHTIHRFKVRFAQNLWFGIGSRFTLPHLLTKEFYRLIQATKRFRGNTRNPKIACVIERTSKAVVCLKRKREP